MVCFYYRKRKGGYLSANTYQYPYCSLDNEYSNFFNANAVLIPRVVNRCFQVVCEDRR